MALSTPDVTNSTCTPDVVTAISFRRDRWLQATFLACIAYGIALTLFSMCLYLILRGIYTNMQDRLSPRYLLRRLVWACPRHTFILLAFVLAMTTFSTMIVVSTMKVTRKALVYTGCWDGVTTGKTLIRLDAMGNFAYVLANWGADGLLVWRCWVIYQGASRVPVWVSLSLPVLLYLSVIGMGLFFMGGKAIILARAHTYEMAYSCLTLALNIVVTGMISLRLMFYRYRMRRITGEVEGSRYAGVVSMLVESAALVVVFNAFFVATVGSDSLVYYIAFAGNAQAQIIAPLLIIFRVLQGKAWSPQRRGTGTDGPPIFLSNTVSSMRSEEATGQIAPTTIPMIRLETRLSLSHDLEGTFSTNGKKSQYMRNIDLSTEMKLSHANP